MTSTYFAPTAQGSGTGTTMANAKAWSAANFTTAYTAATSGGGQATGMIAFLNELAGVGCRYQITAALTMIQKELLICGLKSDGSDPVPDVDFLPVFYGDRLHPWPADAVGSAGDNVFKVNENGNGTTFKNLAFNNVQGCILLDDGDLTADVGIHVSGIRFSNVEGVMMAESINGGRFKNGTVEDIRGSGHGKQVIRIFPEGTITIDRVRSDAQNQWSGGSSGASVVQIMESHPFTLDRLIDITTQGTDVVLGNFLLTDAGAGADDEYGRGSTGSTNGSPTLTSAQFVAGDVGALVQRDNVTPGTTILSVTPGVSAVMSANASATNSKPTTLSHPGLGTNTVFDEIVPGVSAKLKDADTLAPVNASTSNTRLRKIWKHDHVADAVQSNITVTKLVGIRCSGVDPESSPTDYPQGDALIAEVALPAGSSLVIDGIYTEGSADRGIDTKRNTTVRNHQSRYDYIAIAQHRTKVTVEVNPIVYETVEMVTEDFFYKESSGGAKDRPNASFFQASGGMRGVRGHMRQVVNNTAENIILTSSNNTNNGPPIDVGDIVLEGGCRITVGDEVELLFETNGGSADLGDSVVVTV